MFSISTRVAAATFLALGAVAGIGGVAGAATLVVRSSGPSAAAYPPGKQLAPASRLVLKANDQVTILDEAGTRTLKGPGTFTPAASVATQNGAGSTLALLVSQRSERRARIGAVRGAGGPQTMRTISVPQHTPNIWYVDAGRSAQVCLPAGTPATLWRDDADAAATATLAGPSGARQALSWAAGEAAIAWPALPMVDGASYTLAWAGGAAVTIKVRLVDTAPVGLEDLASALIARGCKAQLDMLVDTTATGAPGG